jgi:hypothetical protein
MKKVLQLFGGLVLLFASSIAAASCWNLVPNGPDHPQAGQGITVCTGFYPNTAIYYSGGITIAVYNPATAYFEPRNVYRIAQHFSGFGYYINQDIDYMTWYFPHNGLAWRWGQCFSSSQPPCLY